MRLYPRLAVSAAFVATLVIASPSLGAAAGMGGMGGGMGGTGGMSGGSSISVSGTSVIVTGSMSRNIGTMGSIGSSAGYGSGGCGTPHGATSGPVDPRTVGNLSLTGLRNCVTLSPARQSLPKADPDVVGVSVPMMPPDATPADGATSAQRGSAAPNY